MSAPDNAFARPVAPQPIPSEDLQRWLAAAQGMERAPETAVTGAVLERVITELTSARALLLVGGRQLEEARRAERAAAVLLARAEAEAAALRQQLAQAQADVEMERAASAQLSAEWRTPRPGPGSGLARRWRRAARPGPKAWDGISGENAAALLSGAMELEGSPLLPIERTTLEATCRRFGLPVPVAPRGGG